MAIRQSKEEFDFHITFVHARDILVDTLIDISSLYQYELSADQVLRVEERTALYICADPECKRLVVPSEKPGGGHFLYGEG